MIRALLDWAFRLTGAAAALFILAILLLILAQVIGRQIGVTIPSTNEMAALCMAATSFLALGPTLRAGGHIRVSLLLSRLGLPLRRAAELWCQLFAIALMVFFAYWAVEQALFTYDRGRVTPGLIPIPLWPARAAMALGVIMLCVALIEALVDMLRGVSPRYAGEDEALGRDIAQER